MHLAKTFLQWHLSHCLRDTNAGIKASIPVCTLSILVKLDAMQKSHARAMSSVSSWDWMRSMTPCASAFEYVQHTAGCRAP